QLPPEVDPDAGLDDGGTSPPRTGTVETVTATLDNLVRSATVRVIAPNEVPALVGLTPATASVAVNGTLMMHVALSIPAPVGGGGVAVGLTATEGAAVPTSVLVGEGTT